MSSTRRTFISSPPGDQVAGLVGVKVSFNRMLWYQNMMSSALNGSPSDHFKPSLRRILQNPKSSDEKSRA